jgi:site-specific DNA-methyltransferase (adenine-specific)
MPLVGLKPYWTTTDKQTVKLYHGHASDVLRRLPPESVQMAVTSPPYWAIREYHGVDKAKELGNEETPEEFVANLVECFSWLKRVLRSDGTLWVNIGDVYGPKYKYRKSGLVGTPWRLALAMIEDGWILRQELIWSKPNPMPSPVFNPCRNAHEQLFLFAKSNKWYYDADAIREEGKTDPEALKKRMELAATSETELAYGREAGGDVLTGGRIFGYEYTGEAYGTGTRNKGSVWEIPVMGYAGGHFATFPKKLVEPCILAGTSEYGACLECGSPWKRVTERTKLKRDRPNDYVKRVGEEGTGNLCANSVAGVNVKTIGWSPTCNCSIAEEEDCVRPCIVLDPFMGSGTTAAVALEHGRHCWGIDLSEQYLLKNAIPRIEGELLSRPSTMHLVKG